MSGISVIIRKGRPGKRSKEESKITWLQSWKQAWDEQLADYARPDEPTWMAPQRDYVLDPDPHWGDETIEIFCGVLVRMSPQHPLRHGLPYWARKEHSTTISSKPTFANGVSSPADHETCEYDDRYRLRVPETMGGYRRSGPLDGNGVKAPAGMAPNHDDFEDRWAEFYTSEHNLISKSPCGIFANFPDPKDIIHGRSCPWLHLFRFQTSRATRLIAPVASEDSAVTTYFAADEGSTQKTWRNDPWPYPRMMQTYGRAVFRFLLWHLRLNPPDWFMLHYAAASAPWPFTVPPETCTDAEIHEWLWKYWNRGSHVERKSNPPITLPSGAIYTTWPSMPRKQDSWWSRNWRESWSAKWRTERKMVDLEASLELENYGWQQHEADGTKRKNTTRYNPKRMAAITAARVYPAWLHQQKTSGITVSQRPDPFKTRRSLTTVEPRRWKPVCYDGEQCTPFTDGAIKRPKGLWRWQWQRKTFTEPYRAVEHCGFARRERG